MEDIEGFVRVPCEELDGLIFGGQEVKQREVDNEEDAAAVGEDEKIHHRERHAVEVIKDVEQEERENEEGDRVWGKGFVDVWNGGWLVLKRGFEEVVWFLESHVLSLGGFGTEERRCLIFGDFGLDGIWGC